MFRCCPMGFVRQGQKPPRGMWQFQGLSRALREEAVLARGQRSWEQNPTCRVLPVGLEEPESSCAAAPHLREGGQCAELMGRSEGRV